MIKYKKYITIDRRRNGAWRIQTDVGDEFETTVYTQIPQWWETQHQSEIRTWQKDICIGMTADIFGELELFNCYKKGKGWIQSHDICLIHSEMFNIWILSTLDNFWICQSDGGNISFDVKDSLGSIMNINDRKIIYSVFDELKKQFNPTNQCRYVAY